MGPGPAQSITLVEQGGAEIECSHSTLRRMRPLYDLYETMLTQGGDCNVRIPVAVGKHELCLLLECMNTKHPEPEGVDDFEDLVSVFQVRACADDRLEDAPCCHSMLFTRCETRWVVQVANFTQVAPSDEGLRWAGLCLNAVLSQPAALARRARQLFRSMPADCRSLATHASFCAIRPNSIVDVVRLIAPIMREDVVSHMRPKHPKIHVTRENCDSSIIAHAAKLSSGASLVCQGSLVRHLVSFGQHLGAY